MSDISGGAPAAAPAAESGAQIDSSSASHEGQGQEQFSGQEHGGEAEAIQDAVEAGDLTPAEAKSMLRKFQLKVKGQVIEREVDLGDEDYIRNRLQLAEVAQISQQERAEQEKLFRELINNGKGDPLKFIQELYGIDPDDLAASHIEKKIEHLKKSPEAIEKEKMQAELQAFRDKAAKLEAEKEHAEMSKLQSEALSGLKEEIGSAISSLTKLPNIPYVEKRFADAMQWAVNNGFEDVTAADVAPMVEQEMRDQINSLMDMMPEEVVENFVGKKNLARLKAKNVAEIQAKKAAMKQNLSQVKPTSAGLTQPEKKVESKVNAKDFWRKR